MQQGEDYFIALELDHGEYAFDASFRVYTAMGIMPDNQPEPVPYDDFYKFDQSYDIYAAMGTITDPPYDVYSKANPGESFYKDALGQWLDFYNYDAYTLLRTKWNDQSWNFAITGYTAVVANPCEGNFDEDDDADDEDLVVFTTDFGRSDCIGDPPCETAFNLDSDVDGTDLAVFAADFGRENCN